MAFHHSLWWFVQNRNGLGYTLFSPLSSSYSCAASNCLHLAFRLAQSKISGILENCPWKNPGASLSHNIPFAAEQVWAGWDCGQTGIIIHCLPTWLSTAYATEAWQQVMLLVMCAAFFPRQSRVAKMDEIINFWSVFAPQICQSYLKVRAFKLLGINTMFTP